MKELIKKLSDLRGISGFEYSISDEVSKFFEPYCDYLEKDALGNVIAVKKCNKENAKKVMIEAHMDEIGLMVRDIDERGFITFVNVGGVDGRILPSAEVIVHGKKDILGVIGAKPPHLQSADEAKKSAKMTDMAIDVGMSREKVAELVSVGDAITLSQSVGELGEGQFSGKTLDDRAGLASIITVMKNLSDKDLNIDVYAVAATQEEVGLRGAKTATYKIEPDIAIAVDVCHGVTPDNSENAFDLGSGAIVTMGPNIHPKLAKRLLKTADQFDIKVDIDVDSGDTGTDAWVMQVSGNGVPTALLSIPLKYMHTSVETLSLSDAESVASLLTRFIENLDNNMEDWLCF